MQTAISIARVVHMFVTNRPAYAVSYALRVKLETLCRVTMPPYVHTCVRACVVANGRRIARKMTLAGVTMISV